MGQKSSDHSCIPLCGGHHTRWPDSIHAMGPVRFAETHGIDIAALIEELNQFFYLESEQDLLIMRELSS